MNVLARIKKLILLGNYKFTRKAQEEMANEDITALEVAEAIVNAIRLTRSFVAGVPGGAREAKNFTSSKG